VKELRVTPGTVLAASPELPDSSFSHSAILMCEHTEEGAFGLVFNRLAGLSVRELFPEHPLLHACTLPVYEGGPVGMDTAQFVHQRPDLIPGGEELANGVFLGGDFEALSSFLSTDSSSISDDVRLFVGYSGWGPGQLDDELRGGSWLPALLIPEVLFGEGEESSWRAVIRSIEGMDGLSHQPPDSSWN
jgi:putative transcriptional regulator